MNQTHIVNRWYAYIYDQFIEQPDDKKSIMTFVGETPQRILEVACGSGRLCVPLARAGHDVTGFDIDTCMLERIPAKAAGLPNLRWFELDALSGDWGGGYDVVIMSGNLLVNIVTSGDYTEAQRTFIRKAAQCVRPGGHLYLDFDCVDWDDETGDNPREWVCFEGTDDLGTYGKFIVVGGTYDRATRINRSSRRYEITPAAGMGEPFTLTRPSVKHFPTMEQVASWLTESGWAIECQTAPPHEGGYHPIIWAVRL